jgi:hypothetical protein
MHSFSCFLRLGGDDYYTKHEELLILKNDELTNVVVKNALEEKGYSMHKSERRKIFEHYLSKSTHNVSTEQFEKLAQLTDGYSGSDISTIVQSSKLKSIKEFQKKGMEQLPVIQLYHVEESLQVIKPTVTKLELKNYEKFAKEF